MLHLGDQYLVQAPRITCSVDQRYLGRTDLVSVVVVEGALVSSPSVRVHIILT
jgi:hypothetical protein